MSEGLGETLHALGDVVDGLEAAGGTVTAIETASERAGDDHATTIDVELPLAGAADLELALVSASLEEDGTLALRLQTGGAAGSVSADGGARPSAEGQDDTTSEGADPADGDPPYKDPERLRAVYAAHDSFPAMTEALGVDVTPQTVRRHMIEAGIHEPETPPSTEPGEPTEVTDGGGTERDRDETGPPALADFEDISLEELTEAVRSARTIREVGRRLDVPRERAFRLLNTLGLIDLVSGRLRSADRRVSAEELEERIQRATAEE